jgi:hypothetical protein
VDAKVDVAKEDLIFIEKMSTLKEGRTNYV